MKRAIVLCLILAGLTPVAARAAWNQCTVSADAGSWQVRKITIPDGPRAMSLSLTLTYPRDNVTDDSNWHLFGGVWVLGSSSLKRVAYGFLDATSLLGPPFVRATFQGQDVIGGPVPSSGRPSNGAQGAYLVPAEIGAGTYYVVGFGSGQGSFTGGIDYNGDPLQCEAVDVSGRIYDFDASDFTGGTQIMTPGHAHVSDARLAVSPSEQMMVGGLYAYEPQPLPPARLLLEHDRGSILYENQIAAIATSMIRNWRMTANYTGKSNTILIQAFGFDLPTSA